MYTVTIYYIIVTREKKTRGGRNGRKSPEFVDGRISISDTSGFPERRGKMRENT